MSITSAILQRTFRLRCGNDCGTCFTFDVDDKRYVVTARHLAGTIAGQGVIEIWHDGSWKQLEMELAGHGQGDVDVTVLAPKQLFGGGYPITEHEGYTLGQKVYFLGFPFGLGSEAGHLNQDFPIPWVKSGIVSAFDSPDRVIYLDGQNNPGFSGGPVVIDEPNGVRVLGIVSGYRPDRRAVLDRVGNVGPYTYDLNSGIVVVHDAGHIAQIASSNPAGVQVK